MSRIFVVSLLCLTITGCSINTLEADALGIKIGDRITLQTEGATVVCEIWQSTASIWLSTPKKAICAKSLSDVNESEHIFRHLPIGTKLNVVDIKWQRSIEWQHYLVYVQESSTSNILIIDGRNFSNLAAPGKRTVIHP